MYSLDTSISFFAASVIPSMQKSDQPASRPQRQTLAEVSVAIHQAREEQSDFERQAKRPKLGTVSVS